MMSESFGPTTLDDDVGSSIRPYPGLRPFRPDEDYLFFGRDAQVTELLGRLRQTRFLAVLGSSGSGKSSLVRAGLLPALDGGSLAQVGSSWEIAVMHPGGDPFGHLARALCDAELYTAADHDEDVLPYLRATLHRSRAGLTEAVRQSSIAPGGRFLLVVDQFEELFRFVQGSSAHQHAAAKFVDLLLGAAAQDKIPTYVVLTMRADFLGECSRLPGLVDAINRSKYLVPRLSRDELREVIEGPARVAGGEISPRLSQRLLNEVGEDPDQLPILQHALMRTWSCRYESDGAPPEPDSGFVAPVDLDHFHATGGLREALSRHADEVYDSLPSDRHREIAERVYRTLTVREPDGQDVRRPMRLATLAEIADARLEEVVTVVDAYRQPGVTLLMPGPEIELHANTIIDVSHESLMRVWRRLHAWVDDEAQSVRIFGRLASTARLWKAGRAGFYRDPDLEIARKWTQSAAPNKAWAELYGGGFDEAMEFLTASHDAAKSSARAREEERRRRIANAERLSAMKAKAARGMRWFTVSLIVGLLLAAGLSVWALRLRHEAQKATGQVSVLLSESRHRQGVGTLRIAQSLVEDGNLFDAKLFAARAMGFSGFGRSRQDDAFRDAFPVWLTPGSAEFKTAETVIRGEADFLPLWRTGSVGQGSPAGAPIALFALADGKRLVHVRRERVDVWNRESGEMSHAWTPHDEWASAAALSHDRGRLATASDDRSIRIWRTDTWALEREVTGQDDAAIALAFSADGSRLASLADDGIVRVYETDSFEMSRSLSFEIGRVGNASLEFHPSGRWILGSSHRGPALRLWDVESRRRVDDAVLASGWLATFSPDGRWLAVAHGDGWSVLAGVVELWRVDAANGNGSTLPTFTRTQRWTIEPNAKFLRFDPSSSVLAAGSSRGGKIEFLGVLDGADSTSILSRATLESVVFSPDGKTLFAQNSARSVRSYRLSDGEPIRPPEVHGGLWTDAEFHPDGRTFATAGDDGDVRIWDTCTGQVCRTLRGHARGVTDIEYGPEGRILASISTDRTIRIWNVDSSRRGETPVQAESPVQVIPFADGEPVSNARLSIHPDGKTLACATRVRRSNADDETMVWLVDRLTAEARLLVRAPVESGRLAVFSPCGELLAIPNGSAIELWDWKKGEIARRADGAERILRTHRGSVERLAFDPRGRYLVSSGWPHAEFVLWDLSTDTPAETRSETPIYNHFHANFSFDGRYLGVYHSLINMDGTVGTQCEIWELRRGRSVPLERVAVLPGRPWGRGTVRMAPDNRLVLVREEEGVELQHVSRGQERYRIPNPTADFSSFIPRAACYDAERDRLFVGTDDGEIRIYEIASGAFLGSIRCAPAPLEHGTRVTGIRLSPDRTRLYATTQATFHVWRLSGLEAELLTREEAPTESYERVFGGGFTALELSSDGELLVTGGFEIRPASDPEVVLCEFRYGGAFPMVCAFRPGRHELAAQWGDTDVRVHDLSDPTSPREVFRATWVNDSLHAVSYTADGTKLLVSTTKEVRVLDADTGRLVHAFAGAYTVEPSPGGRWIASGQQDGRLKLLDAKSFEVVFEVQAHAGRVHSLAFSADETQLVSIDSDSICVWDLESGLDSSLDLASYLGDLEWDLEGIRHKPREPGSNLYPNPESRFKSLPGNSLPRFLGRGGDPIRASRALFWRYLREGSADSARIVLREIPAEADSTRERIALCELHVGRARDEGTSRAMKLLELRRALEVKPGDDEALGLRAEIERE